MILPIVVLFFTWSTAVLWRAWAGLSPILPTTLDRLMSASSLYEQHAFLLPVPFVGM